MPAVVDLISVCRLQSAEGEIGDGETRDDRSKREASGLSVAAENVPALKGIQSFTGEAVAGAVGVA